MVVDDLDLIGVAAPELETDPRGDLLRVALAHTQADRPGPAKRDIS